MNAELSAFEIEIEIESCFRFHGGIAWIGGQPQNIVFTSRASLSEFYSTFRVLFLCFLSLQSLYLKSLVLILCVTF